MLERKGQVGILWRKPNSVSACVVPTKSVNWFAVAPSSAAVAPNVAVKAKGNAKAPVALAADAHRGADVNDQSIAQQGIATGLVVKGNGANPIPCCLAPVRPRLWNVPMAVEEDRGGLGKLDLSNGHDGMA